MTEATITRSRVERIALDRATGEVKCQPVYAERVAVHSARLKVSEVLAFAEALRAAGAKDDALVILYRPEGNDTRSRLSCEWSCLTDGASNGGM